MGVESDVDPVGDLDGGRVELDSAPLGHGELGSHGRVAHRCGGVAQEAFVGDLDHLDAGGARRDGQGRRSQRR